MIDSHCHLDHEPLLNNLDQIIKRSKDVGIEKLLTICTTLKSFEKIKRLVKKDTIIFGTYGIHPHEAKNNKVTSELIVKEVKSNDKIIGIGETGLDFYYNHSEKEDQIRSFEHHIKASIELNIPLIVHSRSAEDETINIIKKFKNHKLKILMHCFTGSKKFAESLLNLDAYFSASGIITFKNSLELQDTFSKIPIKRPPMMAPGTDSKPPKIKTGKAFKAIRASEN